MSNTVNTIYEVMKKAKVEIDNHCSDLYVPVNDTTRAIVKKYEFKCNVTTFICQIDNKPWFDIPFAYEPYYAPMIKRAEILDTENKK